MSDRKQLFSASLAKNAVYRTGLRSVMEYRDLGIEQATHGQFRAHILQPTQPQKFQLVIHLLTAKRLGRAIPSQFSSAASP